MSGVADGCNISAERTLDLTGATIHETSNSPPGRSAFVHDRGFYISLHGHDDGHDDGLQVPLAAIRASPFLTKMQSTSAISPSTLEAPLSSLCTSRPTYRLTSLPQTAAAGVRLSYHKLEGDQMDPARGEVRLLNLFPRELYLQFDSFP